MELREGAFSLTPKTKIVVDAQTANLGEQLKEMLSPATGYSLNIVDKSASAGNAIYLKLDPALKDLGEEGYRLTVSNKNVTITAAKPAGVFYGMQTLRQLLPAEIFKPELVKGVSWRVPCVVIEDTPRFSWRGMHLDVARYFMPKEFVKKYIDLMAIHKMNTFHWHLTEDQGWRIEIKKYPKLTEVGAWRKETVIGKNTGKYDGKRHGGFYTQDDVREIVEYAKQRYITVVPEIEMPGHCQAAIAAYPQLGNTSEPLEVFTKWGVNPNVFNVEDSTIQFLQDVLTEVLELFPSEFIHIGGDECPKAQWKKSPKAQAKIKALGLKDEHELQSWFIKQMDVFLAERGRRLIGWDEILEGGLAPSATVMSWRGQKGGIAAAKAGHDVVMAPNSHTYFDHYQADPKKEPYAIGGFLPLKKVYSYDPIPNELTAEQAKHVLGAQAQIWTEYIPNGRHVEYMAFPRECALAEVVWTPAADKDYQDFYNRLETHLERLENYGVNFRPLDVPRDAVGSWKSGQTSEQFKTMQWDLTSSLQEPGDYQVTFEYTGGTHRLDIEWVELRQGEKVLSRDEHPGVTGGSTSDNTYELSVPTAKGKTPYTLYASVRSDGGTDSNGTIYCVKIK
jgi:hexosaminidase